MKNTIGTIDRVDFPEFDLEDLACKIDTGAASSAIHCQKIRVTVRDGVQHLSFQLLDPRHPAYNKKTFSTTDFRERTVRSSFGQEEIRYAIKTKVILFGKTYTTEFTLADRVKMKYPVLLGKRLLKRGFLVDVTQKDLSFAKKYSRAKKKESQ